MLKMALLFAALSIGLAMFAPAILPMMREAPPPASLPRPVSQASALPVLSATASPATREHEIAIPADPLGQYTADVALNGQRVPMLIDTGASLVVVSAGVADRIGLFPPPNARRVSVRTANGLASATLVSLTSVAIGPVYLTDVQALIADRSAGEVNLVGASVLSRLGGVEQRSGYLYLRQ